MRRYELYFNLRFNYPITVVLLKIEGIHDSRMAYIPDKAKSDGHVYKYNVPRGESAWEWNEQWNKKNSQVADIVKNFSWKDDDVLVLAFPRSGNHMTWTICRMLLQGYSASPPDPMEEADLFFFCYKENQPGRRVLCTHMLPAELPEGAFDTRSKRKFVIVQRNPKDNCVSCYNLIRDFTALGEPADWPDFVNQFMEGEAPLGNWWLYARGSEEFMSKNPDASVLLVTYEDVVKRPAAMIKKIGDFIGVNPTEVLCEQIAAAIQIDRLRKTVLITPSFDEFWIDVPNKEKLQYRKGKVGDWKDWFTVAQSRLFDEAWKKHMDGSKLKCEYE